MKGTHRENLLCETVWVTLKNRRKDHKLIMMYKLLNNLTPIYLSELCPIEVTIVGRIITSVLIITLVYLLRVLNGTKNISTLCD